LASKSKVLVPDNPYSTLTAASLLSRQRAVFRWPEGRKHTQLKGQVHKKQAKHVCCTAPTKNIKPAGRTTVQLRVKLPNGNCHDETESLGFQRIVAHRLAIFPSILLRFRSGLSSVASISSAPRFACKTPEATTTPTAGTRVLYAWLTMYNGQRCERYGTTLGAIHQNSHGTR
jgi:hypothetical protein